MLALIFAVALALANVYHARVERVIDGDTVRVTVRIWHDQDVHTSIRLRGIDTPELRARCARERELALAAKAALVEMLPAGSTITLTNLRPDKYGGRFDADARTADGRDPAAELIAQGHARAYGGEARLGWCL